MTKQPTLYKVLREDGTTYHGGTGRWHLPTADKPGRWMPAIRGTLVACQRGYHVVTLGQLPAWLGPAIFEVEVDGELLDAGDKMVARKARLVRRLDTWNETTARLFAADCAEHVLPLFEQRHPDDRRPRQAIEAARAFARGQITRDQLAAASAAARDAARDAAWAAAWAAAWDAAWDAASAAASAAARDAARDAAWAAAWAAAWDAGIEWQAERLRQYLREAIS